MRVGECEGLRFESARDCVGERWYSVKLAAGTQKPRGALQFAVAVGAGLAVHLVSAVCRRRRNEREGDVDRCYEEVR